MTSPSQEPDRKQTFKEKFLNSLQKLKAKDQFGSFKDLTASNTRDSVAYVLLIIGIILLFFHQFYGGLLIGLIAGFYFSAEILAFLQAINHLVDEQGIVRSLVAGALLVGLLISAPGVFLGMAAAVGIRKIFFPERE